MLTLKIIIIIIKTGQSEYFRKILIKFSFSVYSRRTLFVLSCFILLSLPHFGEKPLSRLLQDMCACVSLFPLLRTSVYCNNKSVIQINCLQAIMTFFMNEPKILRLIVILSAIFFRTHYNFIPLHPMISPHTSQNLILHGDLAILFPNPIWSLALHLEFEEGCYFICRVCLTLAIYVCMYLYFGQYIQAHFVQYQYNLIFNNFI